MLQSIKAGWRALRNDPPGQRFERRYDRRKLGRSARRFGRFFYVAAGIVLLLTGVCFMPLPGPGLPIVAAGAAIIAGESRYLARLLDRMELWLRQRHQWLRLRMNRAGR